MKNAWVGCDQACIVRVKNAKTVLAAWTDEAILTTQEGFWDRMNGPLISQIHKQVLHDNHRREILAVVLLAAFMIVCGCGRRVLSHRGAMTMDGVMGMDGDMRMDGGLTMNGDINTSMVMKADNRASRLTAVTVQGNETASHKVAIIDVDGVLVDQNISGIGSMGENPVALFREKIREVEKDPKVRAVVLRINSPGGGVTASDIMCHDLIRLKQNRNFPIIACVMVTGTGGAYYLASHCDAIIGHPTSVVGGIGVILNTYNLEDTMGQFNILAEPVKSGGRIDAGTPERGLEDGEMEMLQSIADAFHQRFIQQVESARPSASEKATWSGGDVYSGEQAVALGLVDKVGYIDDAISMARAHAGLDERSSVVLYRRKNDRAYTELDVTPNTPTMSSLLPIKVPGLDRSSMPTFLYLWQADSSLMTRF